MQLWVYREQRRRWWGRPRYLVSLKIGVTADEGAAIARHVLWRDELYLSPAAAELDAKAESLLDLATAIDGVDAEHVRKRLSLRRDALRTALAAERETRIDVASALVGRTVVAHDIVETMMVENGLKSGFAALKSKLDRLLAHERGEEAVLDDSANTSTTTGPADWAEARRIKL